MKQGVNQHSKIALVVMAEKIIVINPVLTIQVVKFHNEYGCFSAPPQG